MNNTPLNPHLRQALVMPQCGLLAHTLLSARTLFVSIFLRDSQNCPIGAKIILFDYQRVRY